MYDIETIQIYVDNISDPMQISIDVMNQRVYINQKEYKYEAEDIVALLHIIRLWNTDNLNSSKLDEEIIEIYIKGNNFEETIRNKISNLKNYNQFRNWVIKYYE